MRTFAVRAQDGAVSFSPVRALLRAGVTEAWPPPARGALRLVAPDDPACAVNEGAEESRAGPDGSPHTVWVARTLGAVARAWFDQVGPCRVEVIDAERLDDASRLFFAALAEVSEGRVTVVVRPREPSVAGPAPLPSVASARERRIEDLVAAPDLADGEEVDFLYRQALAHLRDGDAWTAHRLLDAVLTRRPVPAVQRALRSARELLVRLPGGLRAPGAPPSPGGQAADGGAAPDAREPAGGEGRVRGPMRLRAGWERLEKWSDGAGQIDRNAVHKALFAIADRSAFRAYETVEDPAEPLALCVRVRERLVLKVRAHDLDTFDIVDLITIGEAPGVDAAAGRPL
ncbi:DUF6235 family protein [Streptomyces sp. NPDC090025]|uniref:DUF6235 family protein n=1 Tax=Streptomyces sp. NPDC090025 TaxID=3365922 RepID=UPI0038376B30